MGIYLQPISLRKMLQYKLIYKVRSTIGILWYLFFFFNSFNNIIYILEGHTLDTMYS